MLCRNTLLSLDYTLCSSYTWRLVSLEAQLCVYMMFFACMCSHCNTFSACKSMTSGLWSTTHMQMFTIDIAEVWQCFCWRAGSACSCTHAIYLTSCRMCRILLFFSQRWQLYRVLQWRYTCELTCLGLLTQVQTAPELRRRLRVFLYALCPGVDLCKCPWISTPDISID